jgi:hypothetical protein
MTSELLTGNQFPGYGSGLSFFRNGEVDIFVFLLVELEDTLFWCRISHSLKNRHTFTYNIRANMDEEGP